MVFKLPWAPKGPKIIQKGRQSDQNGAGRMPKGDQMEPKGSPRKPKGAQMEAKGYQKGAKGRPKCIQKDPPRHLFLNLDKAICIDFWQLLGSVFERKINEQTLQFYNLRFLDFCREYSVKIVFCMIRRTKTWSKIFHKSMRKKASSKFALKNGARGIGWSPGRSPPTPQLDIGG